MALFSSLISFLFLTTLVLFSLQINARDSQFFSKVTPLNNNNNVNEEREVIPYNERLGQQQQQQKPVFIPETTENSYGLYGHESGLNPPSTTSRKAVGAATYQPQSYKTESDDDNKYFYSNNNNNDVYEDGQTENQNNYNNNNNNDVYEDGQPENQNNYYYNNNNNNNDVYEDGQTENQNNYYNNNNGGGSDKYFYNNKNVAKKGVRQGISDTKFMEGGKYFYDVNSEKYNPTLYGGSTRGVNSESNWSNNKGYFGYNNNVNSYQNNENSMERYQNQNVVEDDQVNVHP